MEVSTAAELLASYLAGVRSFCEVTLVEADLHEALLSEANLLRANLSGANLSNAILSGAILVEAHLSRANLSGANLIGANLSGANLSGANLTRANLTGANLVGANLSDADLNGVDLSEANLTGANLVGANLSDADLNGVDLSEANLTGANLVGANLSDAALSRFDLSEDQLAFYRPRRNPSTVIPVFYATDRETTGNVSQNHFFSGRRGQLRFGVTKVSIPKDHRFGEIEGPQWWRLELRENPTKHIVCQNIQELTVIAFQEQLRETLVQSSKRDVLVFIHGYNTSFKDAACRTAQIAFDLKFQGVPIFYSWPSEARTLKYTVDESNIVWTVPHFLEFLQLLTNNIAASSVHIIAHSMGNRLLVDALRYFNSNALTHGSASIRQIIFAAPDIDADTFHQIANNFWDKAERFTLYASSSDKALKLSKKLHGYPRAGDSHPEPIVVNGVDTIDASEIDTSLLSWGHSYFVEQPSILSDIFSLVSQGLSPEQRVRLVRRELNSGNPYWFFQP